MALGTRIISKIEEHALDMFTFSVLLCQLFNIPRDFSFIALQMRYPCPKASFKNEVPRDLIFKAIYLRSLGMLAEYTFCSVLQNHKKSPSVLFGHWRAGASAGASLEVSCPGGPPCEAP